MRREKVYNTHRWDGGERVIFVVSRVALCMCTDRRNPPGEREREDDGHNLSMYTTRLVAPLFYYLRHEEDEKEGDN